MVLQPFAGAGFPLDGARAPLTLSDLEGYDSNDATNPINVYLDGLSPSGGTEFEGPLSAASTFLGDPANHLPVELAADDGGDLRDLFQRSQPVETGHQRILQCRRNGHRG